MAGTLVLDTLRNGAGTYSTSADNVIRGCAKAWVNFDGTPATPTIRGSFNVSSITDNGTGNYTINFTTAMPNANYCFIPNASYNSQNLQGSQTISLTTTSVQFQSRNAGNNTAYDMDQCHAAVFSN